MSKLGREHPAAVTIEGASSAPLAPSAVPSRAWGDFFKAPEALT